MTNDLHVCVEWSLWSSCVSAVVTPMKSPFLEAIPSIEKSASTDIYIYSTDHTTFNDIIKLTAASSLGLFNALHATELTGKLSAALNEGLNA